MQVQVLVNNSGSTKALNTSDVTSTAHDGEGDRGRGMCSAVRLLLLPQAKAINVFDLVMIPPLSRPESAFKLRSNCAERIVSVGQLSCPEFGNPG
jgi:hypothetical protein